MNDERQPDPQPDPDEAPMDTGMPPGVHPNSEDPDPEVVEKADRENDPHPSEEKLDEDYRP
jgi:hypothetical protein